MPRPGRTGPPRMLPVVLLFALGVRALAWRHALMMTNDGPDFLWQAQRILAGDWASALAHHYHPLYAMLAAGASWLAGGVEGGAVLVSIAAGLAAVLATYALARRALPERPDIALAAAFLAALHSGSVTHTSDVRNDGLHAALFVVTVATLLAACEQGGWRWPAAGLTAGLAYLTRPEALLLVVPAAAAVAGCARRRGVPAAARGAAALSLALALTGAPYVVALHERTGEWVLSMKPSVAQAGGLAEPGALPPDSPIASPIVPRSKPAAAPAAVEARTAEARRDEPASSDDEPGEPERLADDLKVACDAFTDVARWDYLGLAALGLAPFWRRSRGLVWTCVATIGAWLLLATLHHLYSGYLNDRHMLAAALLVLPVAGAGFVWLWDAPRLRLLGRVACVCFVALVATGAVKRRHPDHGPRLEALAWAAEHTTAEERIGVHRRKDGWYSGRPVLVIELPCSDSALRAAMARTGTALLVLDEHTLRGAAPHWLEGPLFDVVARFGEGRSTVVVLALRG